MSKGKAIFVCLKFTSLGFGPVPFPIRPNFVMNNPVLTTSLFSIFGEDAGGVRDDPDVRISASSMLRSRETRNLGYLSQMHIQHSQLSFT